MRNCGVKDIFIACVEGLKGFPQAIETAFESFALWSGG
jgi:putative transposase